MTEQLQCSLPGRAIYIGKNYVLRWAQKSEEFVVHATLYIREK